MARRSKQAPLTPARKRAAATPRAALIVPEETVVQSSLRLDVQLTVDNLAELPAGQLEDQLDEMRARLQQQQAACIARLNELAEATKAETTRLATDYTHGPAVPLAQALGAFLNEPCGVLNQAEACDLNRRLVVVEVQVLTEQVRQARLKRAGNEETHRGYYSSMQEPEISTKVELPFSPQLSALQAQIEATTAERERLAQDLVRVQSAYARLPKLRERAKRQLTAAVLAGELQDNADVLTQLESLVPREVPRLSGPTA
jgi:hypothetical protein